MHPCNMHTCEQISRDEAKSTYERKAIDYIEPYFRRPAQFAPLGLQRLAQQVLSADLNIAFASPAATALDLD